MMHEGTLCFNADLNRFGVMGSGEEWIASGLHCGQTMEIDIGTGWVPDRIEYGNDWYLSASRLTGRQLEGLKVRC